jgi:hypothetical protein
MIKRTFSSKLAFTAWVFAVFPSLNLAAISTG